MEGSWWLNQIQVHPPRKSTLYLTGSKSWNIAYLKAIKMIEKTILHNEILEKLGEGGYLR